MPETLPPPRCALAAPFRPYLSKGRRYPFCGTFPDAPSPRLWRTAGRYPAPLFRGPRTFLVTLADPAAARPSGRRAYRGKRPMFRVRACVCCGWKADIAVSSSLVPWETNDASLPLASQHRLGCRLLGRTRDGQPPCERSTDVTSSLLSSGNELDVSERVWRNRPRDYRQQRKLRLDSREEGDGSRHRDDGQRRGLL